MKSQGQPQPSNRQLLRYAGMFGQLSGLVAALGYGGYTLDNYFGFEIPVLMITMIILGIVGYIIHVIRTFK